MIGTIMDFVVGGGEVAVEFLNRMELVVGGAITRENIMVHFFIIINFFLDNKIMKKTECSQWFSETIRDTMKEMGHEKSRPQVIAISAKRTIKNHPSCKRYLDRPQERIQLDDKHWILWSSKSFRLHRDQPCALRIFFSKRKPHSTMWKKNLQKIIKERLGVSLGRVGMMPMEQENYLEIPLENPKLILSILNHRVANFLD